MKFNGNLVILDSEDVEDLSLFLGSEVPKELDAKNLAAKIVHRFSMVNPSDADSLASALLTGFKIDAIDKHYGTNFHADCMDKAIATRFGAQSLH